MKNRTPVPTIPPARIAKTLNWMDVGKTVIYRRDGVVITGMLASLRVYKSSFPFSKNELPYLTVGIRTGIEGMRDLDLKLDPETFLEIQD